MNTAQPINVLILRILTFPLIISLLQPPHFSDLLKYVIYSIKLSLFFSLILLMYFFSNNESFL